MQEREAKVNDLVGLALKIPIDDALVAIEEHSPVQLPSVLLPPGY